MAIARVGPKHQVTIPAEVIRRLGIQSGDYMEVELDGDAIRLVPQRLVPRDQAWFWEPAWQAREQEADEAIDRGELSTTFESVADLMRHLRGESQQ